MEIIIILVTLTTLGIVSYLWGKEKGRADKFRQMYHDLSKENAWLLSKLEEKKEREK